MNVGFIGLGTMGAAVAANVRRGGYALWVHDLDAGRAAPLLEAGATWAASPGDLARAVDVVITMVPGPKQIAAVMRGPAGVLSGLAPGKVWVDMTTNSPALFRELAGEVRGLGARPVDAPVTGAVDGAILGQLTLFAGGDEGDIEGVRPLLETMGRVLVMGPSGAGSVTKLVTNQLWFIHAAAVGESMVLAKASGVEPLRLWEAMKGGAADSFVTQHDVPSIFAGHYDPSFTLDLCCKDLGLIVELADGAGTQTDLTRLTRSKFELARETFGGGAGELNVCRLIEDAAGVSLRVEGSWPEHWNVKAGDA